MASFVSTCRLATRKLKLETASRGYKVSATFLAKTESTPLKKQSYPLLPSVEHLLHENGLDTSSIEKMTPTGPNNRLLKGDVLAFLGSIPSTYPTELSSRIEKLSHLDLSNIKLAPSLQPPQAAVPITPEEPIAIPQDTKVATSISLAKVLNVQKRVHRTLGVHLPISTFIARATDLANDHLPRSAPAKPSADELFNAVLGLDKLVPEGVRANFQLQITALPHAASSSASSSPSRKTEVDIIDYLAGKKTVKVTQGKGLVSDSEEEGAAASMERNIFAVTVARGEEKRARVFLGRVKAVLEGEPGRLVL